MIHSIEISLRQWLLKQLSQSILPQIFPENENTCLEIPVYLLHHTQQITYRFRLVSQISYIDIKNPETSDLLSCLAEKLQININLIENQVFDLQPTDTVVELWIKQLYKISLHSFVTVESYQVQPENMIVASVFPIQYTYSRCCAWLRLARQQQLINSMGELLQPLDLIKLPLNLESTDRQLILSLAEITDALDAKTPHNWLKLANKLASALILWDNQAGIWRNNPDLREIRIILLLIIQHYLKHLLEIRLQVFAPTSL